MTARPRTFFLDRTTDPSGVSGTGKVAWGCQFPDGAVVVRWIDRVASSTGIWSSIGDVERVHGHAGSTAIVYDADQASLDMATAVAKWHDEAVDELHRLRTGVTALCALYPMVPVSRLRDLLDRVEVRP